MIYGLKLLLPVLALWGLLHLILPSLMRGVIDRADFNKTFRIVLLFTVVSFLSVKPLAFLAIEAIAVAIAQSWLGGDVKAKIITFWIAVIIFPPLRYEIPGIGGINYLLAVDHFRVAAIMLLLPAALSLLAAKKDPGRNRSLVLDALVVAYPVFRIVLLIPSVSLTSTVRSVVEIGLDLVLPYYVMTRGIRDLDALRDVLRRLLVVCMFAAAVAFLEAAARTNIYSDLQWVYGFTWSLTHTLMRGGLNRVQAMTPQPILFATQILFTLGLWVAMTSHAKKLASGVGVILLLGALVLTWSRGPWVGALVFGACLVVLPRIKPSIFGCLLVLLVVAAGFAKSAGLDESAMALLKDVFGNSQEDAGSIEYRSRLLDSAIALIRQSPWLGVPNYASQMQSLVQGEGIIDIVNTYVSVALSAGLIGLVLFISPFVLMLTRMLKALSLVAGTEDAERMRFLHAFIALMIACLVTIFTTSIFERLPFLMLFLVMAPAVWLSITPGKAAEKPDTQPNASPWQAGRAQVSMAGEAPDALSQA